jgi:hypothetical protein
MKRLTPQTVEKGPRERQEEKAQKNEAPGVEEDASGRGNQSATAGWEEEMREKDDRTVCVKTKNGATRGAMEL